MQIYDECRRLDHRFRREFDETEAYLRHRARVHEREKREKLKKEGKLQEYLKEIGEEEKKKPMTVQMEIEITLQKYKETKKMDIESSALINYSKFDVVEKKVEQVVKQMKLKKKHKKAKKARMVEDLNYVIEDSEDFKPRMAGKTGMAHFFLSDVVTQNRIAFQKADARNKMMSKTFMRRHWAQVNLCCRQRW